MTLRNAPLLGQDGGSCRDDLPDGRSEIFLQMGLDRKIISPLLICPSGKSADMAGPTSRALLHSNVHAARRKSSASAR
jgi:hypothetical protein